MVVISCYHSFEDPYDVLGIKEENDMVPLLEEDHDDYLRYLGPPIYDSSRVGSLVLENLEDSCPKEEFHGYF